MKAEKIFVVLREVTDKPYTLSPIYYFDNDDDAQKFCDEQERIHTNFTYYVDPVTIGTLTPRNDLEIAS